MRTRRTSMQGDNNQRVAVGDRSRLSNPDAAVSRRSLLGGGLAIAAGAVGLGATSGAESVLAAAPTPRPDAALAATIPGLTYLPLDAFAFDTATTGLNPYRLYQEIDGMQPLAEGFGSFLYASLPIPVGAIIKQINIAYTGEPLLAIGRRAFTGAFADLIPLAALPISAGPPTTHSLSVNATLTPDATYSVKVYCPVLNAVSPGGTIFGMTIGYIPPAQAFIPYSGTQPRVFDSRTGSRFAVGEERVIDLSSRVIANARSAVINLTATDTAGPGFLAAFRDGIVYPGNSSVNYNAAGQSVANGVVVAMAAGRIRVRCGDGASHVIVDVIGSLL